jgi:hypothetical protein
MVLNQIMGLTKRDNSGLHTNKFKGKIKYIFVLRHYRKTGWPFVGRLCGGAPPPPPPSSSTSTNMIKKIQEPKDPKPTFGARSVYEI